MHKEFTIPAFFSLPQTRLTKISGTKQIGLGKKVFVIILALVGAGLLFSYILSVNNNASSGYNIKTLQNEINQLNQENKKLTLEISERASVVNLQSELLQNGYSVVKTAKYLQTDSQYSQR